MLSIEKKLSPKFCLLSTNGIILTLDAKFRAHGIGKSKKTISWKVHNHKNYFKYRMLSFTKCKLLNVLHLAPILMKLHYMNILVMINYVREYFKVSHVRRDYLIRLVVSFSTVIVNS